MIRWALLCLPRGQGRVAVLPGPVLVRDDGGRWGPAGVSPS